MQRDPKKQSETPDLSKYFDGEIVSADEVARFEAMIREDEGLREQLHTLEALRAQLRRLPKDEAPPYLRKKIAYTLSARGRRMRVLRAGSFIAMAGVGLAAAIALMILAGLDSGRVGPPLEPLYAAMVADHAKYQPADPQSEYFGDNPAELESWLSARLAFTPKLPQWGWAELTSGRACSLNQNRVAFVRYRCGGEELSLYIWPTEPDVQAFFRAPHHMPIGENLEVALWSGDNLNYGLVARPGMTGPLGRLEPVK